MKRILAALFAALMAAAGTALAEQEVSVYAAEGAMPREQALQMVRLLEQEFEGVIFSLTGEGETLRGLILADRAPQIALCSLQEAALWAQEGLLLPLEDGLLKDTGIAQAVLAACSREERLVSAPLYARGRRMAVNRALLEAVQLDHLFNAREYPVWTPMQLLQVLEELFLAEKTAMELWATEADGCGAALALAQSLYGGLLFSEDGQTLWPSRAAASSGFTFLADVIEAGMIARAESREAALERFIAGETALFADWTQAEAAAFGDGLPFEMMTVPYPAASGIPVHAFDLIGASALSSGSEAVDALSLEVIAFLMEDPRAQMLLGERGIFEDDAIWLLPPGAEAFTPRISSALCSAMDALVCGKMDADDALELISAWAEKGAR